MVCIQPECDHIARCSGRSGDELRPQAKETIEEFTGLIYNVDESFDFQNIANSEATHMDAVGALIDRYGLEDLAAGKEIGGFADVTLQELYDRLTDEGGRSLAAALGVGAAIEEIRYPGPGETYCRDRQG